MTPATAAALMLTCLFGLFAGAVWWSLDRRRETRRVQAAFEVTDLAPYVAAMQQARAADGDAEWAAIREAVDIALWDSELEDAQ